VVTKPSTPVVQRTAVAPALAAEKNSPQTAGESMLASIKISGA
jgi:hypothetical protein